MSSTAAMQQQILPKHLPHLLETHNPHVAGLQTFPALKVSVDTAQQMRCSMAAWRRMQYTCWTKPHVPLACCSPPWESQGSRSLVEPSEARQEAVVPAALRDGIVHALRAHSHALPAVHARHLPSSVPFWVTRDSLGQPATSHA